MKFESFFCACVCVHAGYFVTGTNVHEHMFTQIFSLANLKDKNAESKVVKILIFCVLEPILARRNINSATSVHLWLNCLAGRDSFYFFVC